MSELLSLPFHEYMARRTKYAVDVAQRTNLFDIDHAGLALLQAMWAREYWINKVQGESK
jgi:hypothetical protein